MSEVLKEIKKLRKEVKEVKNILTDETSKDYVKALIDNVNKGNLSVGDFLDNQKHTGKPSNETDEQLYLEHWTCDHCGEHTHEVDYDYLSNGTNHLGCELKLEMGEKN